MLARHGVCPSAFWRIYTWYVPGMRSYWSADYIVNVVQVLATLWTELQEWGRTSTAKWLGYLSSTSVYGDWGGAWVDERCTRLPSSAHLCAA